MKIIVLVKQVPDASSSDDLDQGRVPRSGAMVLNPNCERALNLGVSLRSDEDSFVAVTMGPKRAAECLQRCLELGADRAYHLCDTDFAGSDVWATARTIARFLSSFENGYDIIICGRRAADGETGQLPSMVAEMLSLPQVSDVVEATRNDEGIGVLQVREGRRRSYRMKGRCLLSVSGDGAVHRLPSLKDLLDSMDKPITMLTRRDLMMEKEECGSQGSHTRVDELRPVSLSREGIKLCLDDTFSAVDAVIRSFKGDSQ